MVKAAFIMITDADTGLKSPEQSLYRLMSWLSPSFPTGAFAYSHGLEYAVHSGLIADRSALTDWISHLLAGGSGWNDAVLFAEAWRRAGSNGDLMEIADLAEALSGSSERHLETMGQGTAFLQAAKEWPRPGFDRLPARCALPVAVGFVAALHGVPLRLALTAYLHGFSNTLVQAALRLLALGQTGGVRIVRELEPDILAVSDRASVSTPDDLGTATVMAEIAALKHECQPSRIFRS